MTSLLQVQFQGVNEGDDPKNLPPGTLLKADNCAMDKARRLVKRAGTTGLAKTAISGSNVAAGERFITNGSNLALSDGQTAFTYVDALAKWNPIDRPPSLLATNRPLLDSTRSVDAVDTAIYGDLLISYYVVSGSRSSFVQVENTVTGESVLPPTFVSGTADYAFPRVLVSGTTAHLLVSIPTGILASPLALTTLTLTTGTFIVADSVVATATKFDAVIGASASGTTLYVAYELDAGASRTKIASYVLSTYAAITSITYTGTTVRAICLAYGSASSRILLISSNGGAGIVLSTTDVNLGAVSGPTAIYGPIGADTLFIAEHSATQMLIGRGRGGAAAGDTAVASSLYTSLWSIAAPAEVAASVRLTYGLVSPSKPWKTASRWYACVVVFPRPTLVAASSASTTPAVSSAVVEIETADSLTGVVDATHPHVATLENQTGWVPPAGHLTKPSVDSAGAVYVVAAYRNREPGHWYTATPVGWNLHRLRVNSGDISRPAPLGSGALCAGAAPYWFDSASAMPYGFAHAPCIESITDTGAGAMAAGVYSYIATYAWRDADGRLHRSTPSLPLSGTAGANRALTVVVSSSSLSSKQRVLFGIYAPNPIFIEIWRTTVGGVGNHYRLSLEPLYQVLTNDPKAATVNLVDTKADAEIGAGSNTAPLTAQEQLYTEQGELANVPPPSLITVATHKNRLAGIAGDLHTVWFSKDSTSDLTQAPGFNEALTLSFSEEKTALASLNAVLVVLGEDGIDVVHGEGPDDTGAGTWTVQRVQTDVGCVNPRSVVTTPMGVLFQSRRGIELLSSGLEVSWVGHSVDDTLAAYPTITSAVLVAAEEEVRFTCNEADGSNGIVLVWDYGYKIWFVRRYKDVADTATVDVAFVDAALIDGVYTMLTAGGQVYRETTAHKLDNGTGYVEMDIILANISAQPGRSGWANANLGFSRVKDITLLGTSVTNHDLKVSVAHDYSASYAYTKTFIAGSAATTVGPKELCRTSPATQKCQAIKIRIQDITPTTPGTYPVSTGDGPIIEALALRVKALEGPARTSAGQQG